MHNLFVFGSFQSLIFVTLLMVKKNKKRAELILLCWFLLFAVHLLFPAFIYYDYPRFISYSGIDVGFFVLHAVFLNLYISSYIRKKGNSLIKILFIIFPISGSISFMLPYFLLTPAERSQFLRGEVPFPLLMTIGAILLFTTAYYYLHLSHQKIKSYRIKLRRKVSNVDGILLKWVDALIFSFYGYFILVLLFFIVMITTPVKPAFADTIVYSGLVLLLLCIGFYGIKQGSIFSSSIDLPTDSEAPDTVKIPDSLDFELCEQIKDFVEIKKIYLDSEIRMSQLAGMLALSPQRLSYILNSVLNQNFYDFINSYRVLEVCSRIEGGQAEKLTILAIALDSGFNSKATFNRLFKKHKGMSPSEFKKRSQLIN